MNEASVQMNEASVALSYDSLVALHKEKGALAVGHHQDGRGIIAHPARITPRRPADWQPWAVVERGGAASELIAVIHDDAVARYKNNIGRCASQELRDMRDQVHARTSGASTVVGSQASEVLSRRVGRRRKG